ERRGGHRPGLRRVKRCSKHQSAELGDPAGDVPQRHAVDRYCHGRALPRYLADVPAGGYPLTARAVATNPGQAKQDPAKHHNMPTWEPVPAPVNLIVKAPTSRAQIYYIHTDYLNTPRLITDQSAQAVWRWDNTEPFGNNVPDENPSGFGNFT